MEQGTRMRFEGEVLEDLFSNEDLQTLEGLADLLWGERHTIAREWSRRLLAVAPESRAEARITEVLVEELNQRFLVMVVDHLRNKDLVGLYRSYYALTRRLIEPSLEAQTAQLSLATLYTSLRISTRVVAERVGDANAPQVLAFVRLATQFSMLVGQAYCDCREEFLQAMLAQQARNEESLRQARDELEHRVQERTTELREAKDAAEAATRAKSRFLAMMSHEIRTPMNAVIGVTALLRESGLTSRQRDYVELVRSAGEDLLGILNDILDFSRIEAGRLTLYEIDFEIRDVIAEVVRAFADPAGNKGLELSCRVHPEIPARLRGDPARLRQVLLNLVGNAVKFTERGRIELSAWLARESSVASPQLRFEVCDTGPGIEPEVCRRLFQPFSQGESSSQRYGGSGLGLAICRQLAGLMGGAIGVDSAPGQGSTFWFIAAFRPAASSTDSRPQKTGTRRLRSEPHPASGQVVLLVEDNEANQHVMRWMLEHFGLTVDVAGNGVQALEAIEARRYDLVLLDCHMPEMDGFEVTEEIRRRENGAKAHLPIIAMTADAMKEDRDQCLAAGMDDYLAKPVRAEALEELLEGWLLLGHQENGHVDVRRREAADQTPQSWSLFNEPTPALDVKQALAQVDGDLAVLRRVAVIALRNLPAHLASIADAVERCDRPMLRESLHALKGAGLYLAMPGVAAAVAKLERIARDGAFVEEVHLALDELRRESTRLEQALTQLAEPAKLSA